MSNGIIVRPIPLTPAQVTATAPYAMNPAFPAGNMADVQPKVVAQTLPWPSGSSYMTITIDLLSDQALDTVAVLFTNLSPAATWTIFATTSAVGLATIEDAANIIAATVAFGMPETTLTPRRFGLWTGAPITRRYLRIFLYDTAANPELLIRAGVIVVGQMIAPVFNFELGSGRKVEDESILRTLPGGERVGERGGRVPVWRGTWSNLTEAEMRQLWSLQMEVGSSRPFLLIEDPDAVTGQAEAIHYGLLEALDFNERTQLDKQRWEMRVRELV